MNRFSYSQSYSFCPERGDTTGSLTWPLEVETAGEYYVWGRVLAPDPEHDSFHVLLRRNEAQWLGQGAWHTRHGPQWTWRPLDLDRSNSPTPIRLSAGRSELRLGVREAGTKIDRLYLTADANDVPE